MQSWRQQIHRNSAVLSELTGRSNVRLGNPVFSTVKKVKKVLAVSSNRSAWSFFSMKRASLKYGFNDKRHLTGFAGICFVLFCFFLYSGTDLFGQSSAGSNLSLSDAVSKERPQFNGANQNRMETGKTAVNSLSASGRGGLGSVNSGARSGSPSFSPSGNSSTLPSRTSGQTSAAVNRSSLGSDNSNNVGSAYSNSNTGRIGNAVGNDQQLPQGAFFQDQWTDGGIVGGYANRPPKPLGREASSIKNVPLYFPEGFLDSSSKTKRPQDNADQPKTTDPAESQAERKTLDPVYDQEPDDYEPNYIISNSRFRHSALAFASLIAVGALGIFVFTDYRYRCHLQNVLSRNQRLLSPDVVSADFEAIEAVEDPEPALIGFFSGNDYSDTARFTEMMNRFKSADLSNEMDHPVVSPVVALPDTGLNPSEESEFFVRKQE